MNAATARALHAAITPDLRLPSRDVLLLPLGNRGAV